MTTGPGWRPLYILSRHVSANGECTGRNSLRLKFTPAAPCDFKKDVDSLLEKGDPVYATIDITMPLESPQDVPDGSAGQRAAAWCLEQQSAGKKLEFCIVSGNDGNLTALFDGEIGKKLKKRSIRRIYKGHDLTDIDNAKQLPALWPEIKRFVLSHIRFCTFPDRDTERIIWFGKPDDLSQLLYLADAVSSQQHGGLYLLFADAAGYEEDWFRLCCHLRNVQPRYLDLQSIKGDADWEAHSRTACCTLDHERRSSFRLRCRYQGRDRAERVLRET